MKKLRGAAYSRLLRTTLENDLLRDGRGCGHAPPASYKNIQRKKKADWILENLLTTPILPQIIDKRNKKSILRIDRAGVSGVEFFPGLVEVKDFPADEDVALD